MSSSKSDELTAQRKIMERNMFRRSSSLDHDHQILLIEISEMPVILNRMGQRVNVTELMNFINQQVDTAHTGYLNYEQFNTVCEKFLTQPAALEQLKNSNNFSFKQLFEKRDFNSN